MRMAENEMSQRSNTKSEIGFAAEDDIRVTDLAQGLR